MSQGLTAERDRFLVLFDRLAEWTNKWIELTPPDKLDWVPIEQDSMKYGDRLARVTTKPSSFTPLSPNTAGPAH